MKFMTLEGLGYEEIGLGFFYWRHVIFLSIVSEWGFQV